MPIMPGLVVMPTVIANTLFSFVKDRTFAVRSPDTLTVISPMYNEEAGAGQALMSLLEQDSMPEQIALSINGSTDATYDVVTAVLTERNFVFEGTKALKDLNAICETWTSPYVATRVNIVIYYRKVSKSESINNLLESGVVRSERLLIIDGDTIFHPAFIRRLRENFYRLRIKKTRKGTEYILENYGLQSGSVTSFTPPNASLAQRFISLGRKAEYAFSSVLREGQAKQLSRKGLFGSSRLYTVIGCGFAVRQDLFPMPTDTETEDHDFTLACQNAPSSTDSMSVAELAQQGFQFIIDGKALRPEECFKETDTILLKKSGNARFVSNALMGTEDPPHFNGFIRQIERWNGGGQQNALKRVGKPLSANVHFTVWTALFESILGIFLLALMPLLLALNIGNPSLGLPPLALGAWLGLDIFMTFLLVMYGFIKLRRAEGDGLLTLLGRSMAASLVTILPFLILRSLNPLTYVASATRVFPQHLFSRRRAKNEPVKGITWERAYVKNQSQTRTQKVFTWTVASFAVSTVAVANLAPYLNPINEEAWQLVYRTPFVDMRDYDYLPFMVSESTPITNSQIVSSHTQPPEPDFVTLSAFCDPTFTRLSSARQDLKKVGNISNYTASNRWRLRMLARLVPLMGYVEDAATAYDVPADLLLMILLNESDLNPLAVGPTDDKGLSQVTSDALTLLKGLAIDEEGQFYNPRLFPKNFSVFDPDFSICAGAAKLSWAMRQPGVDSQAEAYALYINPIHGLINGEISQQHGPLVEAMLKNRGMVAQLANILAVYAEQPELLTEPERQFVSLAYQVHSRTLPLKEAYIETYQLVKTNQIDDAEIYQTLLSSYFGVTASTDVIQALQ